MSTERQSFLYFVQSGEAGPIKIGRSVSVQRRFEALRAGNHALRLLGMIPGDKDLEAEVQARFAAFRQEGEWFFPEKPLLDFLRDLLQKEVPGAREVQEQLSRRDLGAPLTMDEVLAATLRNLGSPESRRGYASDWQAFSIWVKDQGFDVLKVRPNGVRDYLLHLRDRGLKRPSIARALSVIREIYAGFVVEDLLPANPAREVKNLRVRHVPNTPWLTEEEVRKLFSIPVETWWDRRDRMCLCLLLGLGWRRAEVARLRVEDFDGAQVTGVLKGDKTVTVGVPAWLLEEIADWRAFAEISGGPLLFRSPEDRRAISGDIVHDIVRRSAQRAGFPEGKVTPHGLRRTKITLEGERGVSLRERQLAVGHTDQATTDRYDRARDASRQAPGQVLEDLVQRKCEGFLGDPRRMGGPCSRCGRNMASHG